MTFEQILDFATFVVMLVNLVFYVMNNNLRALCIGMGLEPWLKSMLALEV